jgi:hypothetical protein
MLKVVSCQNNYDFFAGGPESGFLKKRALRQIPTEGLLFFAKIIK